MTEEDTEDSNNCMEMENLLWRPLVEKPKEEGEEEEIDMLYLICLVDYVQHDNYALSSLCI